MDLHGSSGSMMTSGWAVSSSIGHSSGWLVVWSQAVCVKCSTRSSFLVSCVSARSFLRALLMLICWLLKNDISWNPASLDVSPDRSLFNRSANFCRTAKRRCRILSVCTSVSSVTSPCDAVLSSASSKFPSVFLAFLFPAPVLRPGHLFLVPPRFLLRYLAPLHHIVPGLRPLGCKLHHLSHDPFFSRPQVSLTVPQPPEERTEARTGAVLCEKPTSLLRPSPSVIATHTYLLFHPTYYWSSWTWMPVYGPGSFRCMLQSSSSLFHPLMVLGFCCGLPSTFCTSAALLFPDRGLSTDDEGLCHSSGYHPLSLHLLARVSSHCYTMPLPMKDPGGQNNYRADIFCTFDCCFPSSCPLGLQL